jgi:hypothetical protein
VEAVLCPACRTSQGCCSSQGLLSGTGSVLGLEFFEAVQKFCQEIAGTTAVGTAGSNGIGGVAATVPAMAYASQTQVLNVPLFSPNTVHTHIRYASVVTCAHTVSPLLQYNSHTLTRKRPAR